MVGKTVCILSIIALSVSLLFLSSGAEAQGPPNRLDMMYASTFASLTPGANADTVTLLAVNIPGSQFDKIITVTGGTAATVHMGDDLTLGAQVGHLISTTTLSLLNNPCRSLVTVDIPFINSSTDTSDTIAWDPKGDHCRDKNDNGLPDYVEKYPEWLLDPFDPDGAGPLEPLIPRARYTGHTMASDNAPPTILSFLVFNPEQLSLLPKPAGDFGDTMGFLNNVILDNPGGELAPSTITDFCVPLMTSTNLTGLTTGVVNVIDDPSKTDEQILPFEYIAGGECDGDDDDYDDVVDDGCFVTPDPCDATPPNLGCDEVRSTHPAAGTGIYVNGSTQTSTHLYGSFYMGQRDVDWDGITSQLDPCPLHVDNDADTVGDNVFQKSSPYDTTPWDPWLIGAPGDGDSDRLPAACDPNNGQLKLDQDSDGFQNGQDNCPLIANDQLDSDLPPGVAAPDNGPVSDGIGDACEPDWDGTYGRLGVGKVTEWECKSYTGGANVDCTANQADWELDPTRVDGAFIKDMVRVGECIGGTDSDGDGWCDDTEDGLGSYDGDDEVVGSGPGTPTGDEDVKTWNEITCPGYSPMKCQQPTCEDSVDNDDDGHTDSADGGCSTPEHISIDVAIGGGTGIDPAPESCSDGVDNDKDGKMDAAEEDGSDSGSDPDCGDISGDTDDDGMPDSGTPNDNCVYCKNPDQVNRDGGAEGDACDTDDDGDLWYDVAEWKKGSDPKDGGDVPAGSTSTDTDTDGFTDNAEMFLGTDPTDKCPDDSGDDAWPLDISKDKVVRMDDVLNFAGKLKQQYCQAGYSKRLDFSGDGVLRMDDVLNFAGKLKQECT